MKKEIVILGVVLGTLLVLVIMVGGTWLSLKPDVKGVVHEMDGSGFLLNPISKDPEAEFPVYTIRVTEETDYSGEADSIQNGQLVEVWGKQAEGLVDAGRIHILSKKVERDE
ncbi:DUF5666 domain-containing protein [Halobacillus litoralis]|uniref:DUF5666 domain-containing protein n=1 Tax=Halobacillus litoralis TaxID=45668 RepID=UPI001CD352EF|nr:DUF5666 domain-containing protein [Halobacillus litoralis]MCA0970174.1 DUF5666 domain-containing protein [Halobacillus litoralis]